MKLLSLLSARDKKNKIPNQIELEGGEIVEHDVLVEKPKQKKADNTWSDRTKFIVSNFTGFLICSALLIFMLRWHFPLLTDNTNPNRTVYLNKSEDGYGLAVKGWSNQRNVISEITPASAADVSGQIKKGEELLSINGVSIYRMRFGNKTITALLNTRPDGVELVVAPMHEDPLWLSLTVGFGVPLCYFIFCLILVKVIDMVWNWWKTRGTVNRVVKLTKAGDGYGFTIVKGRITEISLGGPAHFKGGLKKCDKILKVNGVWVEDLADWRIEQIFKIRNNNMTLEVRRKE